MDPQARQLCPSCRNTATMLRLHDLRTGRDVVPRWVCWNCCSILEASSEANTVNDGGPFWSPFRVLQHDIEAPTEHHPTPGTPESPRPPRPTSPPPASPRPASPDDAPSEDIRAHAGLADGHVGLVIGLGGYVVDIRILLDWGRRLRYDRAIFTIENISPTVNTTTKKVYVGVYFDLVCLGTHLRSHLTLLNTTVRGQILTAEHMRKLETKLVQLLSFPMEFAEDEPKIAYSGNRVLLVPHCQRPLSINSWNVRNYALQIFELRGTCETRANFHVSIDRVRSLAAA